MKPPAHSRSVSGDGSIALSNFSKTAHNDLYKPTVEAFTERVKKGMLDLCIPDHLGFTQLHIAAKRDTVDIAEYIITQNIQKININAQNNAKETPLHLAHSPQMVLLLIRHGAVLILRDNNQVKGIDACLEAVKLPAEYFFQQGIQDSIKVTSLLPFLRSPVKELNKIFYENPKTGESIIGNLYRKYLEADDRNVLLYMIQFHYFLQRAFDIKLAEQNDLKTLLVRVENMITEVFNCDSLDSPINVQRILQPDTPLGCYSRMQKKMQRHSTRPLRMERPDNVNDTSSVVTDDTQMRDEAASASSHLTKQHDLEKQNEHLLQLIEANSFQQGGILQFCRVYNIKIVFDKPQVSGFINELFTSYLQDLSHDKTSHEKKELIDKLIGFWYYNNINKKSHPYLIRSLTLRSCPSVLFLTEFLSKILSLYLVAFVSIEVYAKRFGTDYDDDSTPLHWFVVEAFLALMTVTHVLYEVGQLSDCNWNLWLYLADEWNIADVIDFTLNSAWLIFRILARYDVDYFHTARIILGLVPIPQAMGLLRFLSIYKPLGELVIMLTAMFKEIFMFGIIYIICTIGFGISFYGLFYNNVQFSSVPNTALTLFQYTLSNFDFSAFDVHQNTTMIGTAPNSVTVNYIGILILVVYLVIVTIVLVNLLIARMTNSYEKVDEQSLAEWSYGKAGTVDQFLLLHEHHPFCMLPAPLNIITAVLYPIHKRFLSTGTSICGTVCNIIYAYFGGLIRVFIILASFVADFFNGLYLLVWKHKLPDIRASSILGVLLMPITVMYTLWLAPLVMWKELIAKVHPETGTLSFLHDAINRHEQPVAHPLHNDHDEMDNQNNDDTDDAASGIGNPMVSPSDGGRTLSTARIGGSSMMFAMEDEMNAKLFTEQDCFRIIQCLRLENDPATGSEVRDLKMEMERLQALVKKALKTE